MNEILDGELEFLLGEKRLWVEVTSDIDQNFIIRNAKYELVKCGFGEYETEDSGECTVDGHTLRTTIEPKETGKYSLIFTFEIGGELIKKKTKVTVCK